jgi:drug/metabolite transporter (DMT)-like permease
MYVLRILLLVFGVCSCSTAALFIRASQTHPLLIAAYRLLIASAVLSPAFWRARHRHRDYTIISLWRTALPAAVFLALHFWSWNVSVGMTAIANASLIVNLTPVAMPFVVWIMVREGVHARELAGTAIALCGTLVLAVTDYHVDLRYFTGDLLAFSSMVAFTVYLAWNRRCAHVPSVWLYVPVVYLVAGGLCFVAGAALTGAPWVTEPREWQLLIGLALIPTILGHTILNVAMRTIRSQTVAVVNVGQFIPAGIMAWIAFKESPGVQFPIAALLVVAGALVVILQPAQAETK